MESDKACAKVARGGYVVEINSAEENQGLVNELIRARWNDKKKFFWIGASDVERVCDLLSDVLISL